MHQYGYATDQTISAPSISCPLAHPDGWLGNDRLPAIHQVAARRLPRRPQRHALLHPPPLALAAQGLECNFPDG